MTRQQIERYKHFMHHRAVFHLRDGTTKEGYMQPFDNEKVYITTIDGTSAGSIKLEDIARIEFPEG